METGVPIGWTDHAAARLERRNVPRSIIEDAIRTPELSVPVRQSRYALMKRYYDPAHGKVMLARAIVDEYGGEIVVITAYVTSRIAKYMEGADHESDV